MVVADSLRYNTVFENGSGLNYIEANGINFTQARSAGCWTLPSTASLFTGLSPHAHGATSQTRYINKNIPTLAEKLKLLGYKTYQISANIVTTSLFGLHKGFDEVYRTWDFVDAKFRYLTQLLILFGKPRLRRQLFSKDWLMRKMSDDLSASKTWLQFTHQNSFNLAKKVLAFHEKRNEKCFVFINCMETHFPYHTSPTFSCLSDTISAQANELFVLFKTINQSFLKTGKLGINENGLNLLKSRQRKSWENISQPIDDFFKEYHQNKNNLCIFLGDHGENFGEQGWLYHFSNVTDAGNKVPLFWLSNEEQNAKQIDSHISLKDVHQQIVKAAGGNNSSFDLLNEPTASNPILESFWYNSNGKTLSQFKFNQFAFIDENKKYLNRNGKWLFAELNTNGNDKNFSSLYKTNPIHDLVKSADKRAFLQAQLAEFEEFSKKIKF